MLEVRKRATAERNLQFTSSVLFFISFLLIAWLDGISSWALATMFLFLSFLMFILGIRMSEPVRITLDERYLTLTEGRRRTKIFSLKNMQKVEVRRNRRISYVNIFPADGMNRIINDSGMQSDDMERLIKGLKDAGSRYGFPVIENDGRSYAPWKKGRRTWPDTGNEEKPPFEIR